MRSPNKASISQQNVASYMSETNGGGDPVTALSLRPPKANNIADRRAKVDKEVAALSAVLKKTYANVAQAPSPHLKALSLQTSDGPRLSFSTSAAAELTQ
ncbi:hypothetical protein PG996_003239 [Apiospora saccharicola]|uniref:Uncharacterized protein n=1 Tax=Apiospora saccharicola TaxID=335842 RepID=A0ABR1W0P8_9PEZI